jgi:hypothetical protein
MVFLDLDFTENLKLGSPSALSADHGELIPSQMNALAMDIDQDTHRHHGGQQARPSVRHEGEWKALIRQQSSGNAHIQERF